MTLSISLKVERKKNANHRICIQVRHTRKRWWCGDASIPAKSIQASNENGIRTVESNSRIAAGNNDFERGRRVLQIESAPESSSG